MKVRIVLGLLAALMLAEPITAVAAPANGMSATGYATLAAPPVAEDAAPSAKIEKAYWVRRYWYRPYWRRRFWYRPVWRRYYWRRRFYY